MKSIAPIFGGEAKVKMLRLFVFNPSEAFAAKEIAHRTKENPRSVRRELGELTKAGLVRRRGAAKFGIKKKRGTAVARKQPSYILNPGYPHLAALSDFLIDAAPISEKEIVKRLARCGTKVQMILLSGVFIHDNESRVDLLVVGDHLKKKSLVTAISTIEAELGKEIRFAAFESADFKYRLSMYDKLVRDILDFPHVKVLNKFGDMVDAHTKTI